MPKKTPAADQFRALGLTDETVWTDAMRLAVKQRWSGLPVGEKIADLRDQLAAVHPADVPSVEVLARFIAPGLEPSDVVAAREHARLKRNAAVQAWRTRNQIQAAIDARDLRFKAMRAARGTKAAS